MKSRERDQQAEPPSMEAADRFLGQHVDRLFSRRSGLAGCAHVADSGRVG